MLSGDHRCNSLSVQEMQEKKGGILFYYFMFYPDYDIGNLDKIELRSPCTKKLKRGHTTPTVVESDLLRSINQYYFVLVYWHKDRSLIE